MGEWSSTPEAIQQWRWTVTLRVASPAERQSHPVLARDDTKPWNFVMGGLSGPGRESRRH